MLTRSELASLTERLIDCLDATEPDPDLETNGDELDGTMAEDELFPTGGFDFAPGCPISDPDDDPLVVGEGTPGLDC